MGEVVKIGRDVGCGDGEGDVEAVGSFVLGVVVVVVFVLGGYCADGGEAEQEEAA